MKCIDCKFCACINESEEQITIKSGGVENSWSLSKSVFCLKIIGTMLDVTECTGYSRHKKIKPLKSNCVKCGKGEGKGESKQCDTCLMEGIL